MIKSSDLIETALSWISSRNAAYLAKEDKIVYYSSLTGRSSDYKWHYITITELCRTINTMLLSGEDKILHVHVISAFQELGKVYEFGVKTSHEVKPEIFNFYKEAKSSLPEEVMDMLASELFRLNHFALLHGDVVDMFLVILNKLKYEGTCSAQLRNQLIEKYFIGLGYVVKTTSQRVMWKGKKTNAIMTMDVKPSDIAELDGNFMNWLINRIGINLR